MLKTLLAIETSGGACSAALITPNHTYTRFELTQKAHTQLLLPMVEALIKEANIELKSLDAIAVGRGPGSFTGVRIAVSAAQGLAYGLNIPVYAISTLAALSAQVDSSHHNALIIPAIDARMHEVYTCAFSGSQLLIPECLVKPQELLATVLTDQTTQDIIAIGSGWDAYFEEITNNTTHNITHVSDKQVRALEVGLIAKKLMQNGISGVLAKDLLPVYIRDDVAQKQL
ncbi:MAG: tRNA (adenosine(37)-N6)-threonylcarbamoyltransferase complex dimerization subunit type 1 TsaB [Proteobacteria bacterium]|nr:tRNA (adenosine(37)-N6)-threonylcarbamoyltransferase complex dimerization subunit type 1 TsaB [Pseudomonadota bacterium]